MAAIKALCAEFCESGCDPSRGDNQALEGLQYIADSPPLEHGGFHPQTVQIAKDALAEIKRLRTALLLYHEAWNGCEGNWHAAMKRASANAESALWPNHRGQARGRESRASTTMNEAIKPKPARSPASAGSALICVLFAGPKAVGWTDDISWAIRWSNQLECRWWTSITEITPNNQAEARRT